MKTYVPLLVFLALVGCHGAHTSRIDLTGTWEMVSITLHGEPASQKDGQAFMTVFKGNTFYLTLGGAIVAKGTYTLRQGNPYSELDMIYERDNTNVKCICTLHGDILTICNQDVPRPFVRPGTMVSSTNNIVQVLKRVRIEKSNKEPKATP